MSATPSGDAVEAWAKLLRTASMLLQKVEEDLKAARLPPLSWYDVLLELARAKNGRLRPRELQPRLLITKYNLSRLIDRLEAEGLVAREPCEDDARGAQIRISEAGRELRRRMWPVYEAAIARYFAGKLEAGDAQRLKRVLNRLSED